MTFAVTSLYASILTIAVIVLAILVSAKRGQTGVAILDGGNVDLAVSMRRHGNLVENVPLALLLMALCEARGLTPGWLHAIGVVLLVGRALHLIGLDAVHTTSPLRIAGTVATQISMLGAVVFLLWSLM